jgi:hypothetical protein
MTTEGAGPLEAVLVTETVARHAGLAPVGTGSIVGPGAGLDFTPAVVAPREPRRALRYAATGADALLYAPDGCSRLRLDVGDVTRVESVYGYPLARIDIRADAVEPLDVDPQRVASWWRVAIAAELVGTARAALDLTIEHVNGREQFGRPIGSFQGVQHRLAECAVAVEGARWLTYEAADQGAPEEQAAAAATAATAMARRVLRDTHQFSGALGLSKEYDLHVWSLRLVPLALEFQDVEPHAQALARARWLGTEAA